MSNGIKTLENAQPGGRVRLALKPCTTASPVSAGDWIADEPGMTHPEIAKVQEPFWDDIAGEWVANITMYSPDGQRGRFEPAVPMESWRRIQRPDFPLTRDRTGYRCWGSSLEYLPEQTSDAKAVNS